VPDAVVGTDGVFRSKNLSIRRVIWTASDPAETPHVPTKQTLEWLICAALCEAYPDRAASVTRWLTDPPQHGAVLPKNHALSWLAKWYAEHGPDDFFKELWREERVAAGLRARLDATGAWTQVTSTLDP